MQPRVLFRTHYQVDEPALMELLVQRCTSAVRSAYSETVAERLAKEVRHLGKGFNVPAASYALDLGRGLGLVNEQNAWTDKGHLVNLKAQIVEGRWEDQLMLSARERLLHLRLFLEADGAAFLYIARSLLENTALPNADDDWNALARDLFVHVYSEYLRLTGTTTDRVALRMELDRIRSRGYEGKSGPHKMFIHLQALHRLGLATRSTTGTVRRYLLPENDGGMGLRTLVGEIHDVFGLEEIVKEKRLLEICAKVFQIGEGHPAPFSEPEVFLRLVVRAYQGVMATGVPLSPLTTIIEAVQIELLASLGQLIPYPVAQRILERAQRQRPSDVRFHVDRKGAPAFLRLSDEFVAAYAPSGS